jgi:DNA polymerase I-like protein with 3'-5' exonuclease and polymerase domains
MDDRGPCLDYEYYKIAQELLPKELDALRDRMRLMLLDPEFNPGSQPQVKRALYQTLKLPPIRDKKGKLLTGEEALIQLVKYHEFPGLQMAWRKLAKIIGTYLAGSKRSADAYDGELRTYWWLTGTSTSRLRSSGGHDETRIALQNFHSDPAVSSLLVSDPNWRKVLEYAA